MTDTTSSKIFMMGAITLLTGSAFISTVNASGWPLPPLPLEIVGTPTLHTVPATPRPAYKAAELRLEQVPSADAEPEFTPTAGFIALGQHQSSQFDHTNSEGARARLSTEVMKGLILPNLKVLLRETWEGQKAPSLRVKDDLLAIIEKLKIGNLAEASETTKTLLSRVNTHESATGPIDEFSRLGLYSVQTILHLLAGTPYQALNNFLELRQLAISWHPIPLIAELFVNKGEFYENLLTFFSSPEVAPIWSGDTRIEKLFTGHALFAHDQTHNKIKIIENLKDLGDDAGQEGPLTFNHTLYVLGKMYYQEGKRITGLKRTQLSSALRAVEFLDEARSTLSKIADYRFEGLFSYRNAATNAFLAETFLNRSELTKEPREKAHYLGESLDRYTATIPLIETNNRTGSEMIRNSLDSSMKAISEYVALPDDVSSNITKIAKLTLFREALKLLPTFLDVCQINTLQIDTALEVEVNMLLEPEGEEGASVTPPAPAAGPSRLKNPQTLKRPRVKEEGEIEEEEGEIEEGEVPEPKRMTFPGA